MSAQATAHQREQAATLDFRSDTERDAAIAELLARVAELERRLARGKDRPRR